jgi:hypothetical protein
MGQGKIDPTPTAGLSTKASCFSCIFCMRSAICRNVELQSSMGSFLGDRETQSWMDCLGRSKEKDLAES